MTVSMDVDVRGLATVDDALKAWLERASDLSPAMDEIGAFLVGRVRLRFERERGPDGRPWKPSLRARQTGGKTLTHHGRLSGNEMTHRPGKTSVELGTNVPYAAIHQFGGVIEPRNAGALHFELPGIGPVTASRVTMPARPFLGLEAGDDEEIAAILIDWMTGAAP